MRKLLLTAGFMVGICLLSIVFADDVEQEKRIPPGSKASDLETVVTDLTKRVVALEKRIQKLEERQQTTIVSPAIIPMQRSIPKEWRKREFNGIPYYIVPLSEEQSKR